MENNFPRIMVENMGLLEQTYKGNFIWVELLPRLIRLSPLLVAILIGAMWFSSGAFLYADTHIPLDIESYTHRLLSVWDDVLGYGDVRHLILWPYLCLQNLFYFIANLFANSIQLKLQITELLMYLLNAMVLVYGSEKLFNFIGSLYRNVRELRNENTLGINLLKAILILFLLYNIWSITAIWRPFWCYMFHYSFLPILIYLFLRSCNEPKARNFALLLSVSWFVTIGYVIPHSFFFDLLLLLGIALSLQRFKIRNVVITTSIWILSVSVLLLPFLLVALRFPSLLFSQAERIASVAPVEALLKYNSPLLVRGIAITGYPPFYFSENFAWYGKIPLFYEPLYIVVFIAFIILPLIIDRNAMRNRLTLFLIIYYLAFLTLMCGVNIDLLKGITLGIYSSNPVFSLLRSTYTRFGEYLTIIYTLLAFNSWSSVLLKRNSLREAKNRFVVGLLFILFTSSCILPNLLCAFELCAWRGYSTNVPPVHTKLPNCYEEILNLIASISKEQDGNIVIIPYPTNHRRMHWYQGPPIFVLGSYGRSLNSKKITSFDDYIEMLNILSYLLINNFTNKLYAPYIVVFSTDAIPITKYECNLRNIFLNILSIPNVRDKFIVYKCGSFGNIYLYVQNSSLAPFMLVTHDSSRAYAAYKSIQYYIVGVYKNIPIALTYVHRHFYGIILKKEFLSSLSVNTTFSINLSSSNDIFIYPLMIVYKTPNEDKPNYAYISIRFRKLSNQSVVLYVYSGKNWNYREEKSILLNASNNIANVRFYYAARNSFLSYSIYVSKKALLTDSITINSFGGILKYIQSHANELLEVRFQSTKKVSCIYIDTWVIGFEKRPSIPEAVYLSLTSYPLSEEAKFIKSFTKINPSTWKVYVGTSRPFMLVFAESYDPLWEARVYKDGKLVERVRPVPVYGVINGFWINETGNLTIVIRYVPQDWFELGLKISATTFVLCIFYLVWDWRRNRDDRWAVWLEKCARSVFRHLKMF